MVHSAAPVPRPRRCLPVPHAFTLIELLVVIFIIAFLAASLVPAVLRAKSRAQTIACLGNAKNWSTAMQLYAGDADDYTPNDGGNGITDGNGNKWPDLNSETAKVTYWLNLVPPMFGAAPYYKLSEANRIPLPGNGIEPIYMCPSDGLPIGGKDPAGYDTPYRTPNGLPFYFNYVYNAKVTGAGNRPPRLGEIKYPELVPLLMERRSFNDFRELPSIGRTIGQNPAAAYGTSERYDYSGRFLGLYRAHWGTVSGRHQGGSNLMLADGGARWTSFGDLQAVSRLDRTNHNSSIIWWSPLRDISK